jgi:hypothetical protein
MSIFLFGILFIISYGWSESAGYGLFEIVGYPIYECSSSFGKRGDCDEWEVDEDICQDR